MVIYCACPEHNLYIYAWISNIILHSFFVLEEEKCHLNFSGRLKVKVTGVK